MSIVVFVVEGHKQCSSTSSERVVKKIYYDRYAMQGITMIKIEGAYCIASKCNVK